MSLLFAKCPQDFLKKKNLNEKENFSKYFFWEVEHKVLGLFPETFWQFFRKSFLNVQKNCLGNILLKKTLWNWIFSKTLLKSLRLWWVVFGRFVWTAFYLSCNILIKKTINASETFFGIFGHWAQIVKVSAKLSSHRFTNRFLHVLKGKICVVPILRRKLCFWK